MSPRRSAARRPPPAPDPSPGDDVEVEELDVSEPSLTCGRPLRHPFIIAAVIQPLRRSALD